MKYILVIGDGMADDPVPALGGKTPLEAARKPVMDRLAAEGIVGSVLTVPRGLPAGSDTAILSIFGCDPTWCYTGRAPLEAAASGIALEPGDAAYRCNMVTFGDPEKPFPDRRIISHSAGSIEGDESDAIVAALFEDPKFAALALRAGIRVYPASSFRHMVVQKAVDNAGIRLVPPHDHLGEPIGPLMPSGCPNAEVLKELMIAANAFLEEYPLNQARVSAGKMPANGIWFWAEGTAVKLPNFYERYHKTGGVISAVPLCHGIAALTGLDRITVEGATGELDTNYEGKADAAYEVLQNCDFAAVHIEAPDECTHNGDTAGKILAIERIDERILKPLTERLRANGIDYRMLILSDHKTLTSTRGHGGEPVPFLLYDSRRAEGSGLPYSEANGAKGPYIDPGTKLMELLFALR